VSPAEPTWRTLEVTDNALDILGIVPVLGRPFTSDEGRRAGVRAGMISEGAWKRRFGGSSDVIGTVVRTEQESFEIVGVFPTGFFMPWVRADPTTDLILADRSFLPDTQPESRILLPFVRLAPGTSRDALQAELDGQLAPF